jgi:hypothetical protein
LLQDRVASLPDGLVGAQNERHGTNHEHDGAPSGGAGKCTGGAARAKSGLTACSAESAGEVRGFAALQKHDDNQNQAINDKKCGENDEKPGVIGQPPTYGYDGEANGQGYCPFHPTRHLHVLILNPYEVSKRRVRRSPG